MNINNNIIPKEAFHNPNVIKDILNAKNFELIGEGMHRRTYRVANSSICLKIPKNNTPTSIAIYWMQMEYIMYQMSGLLNFHVIPFTDIYMKGSKEIIEIHKHLKKIAPQIEFFAPIMVQQLVEEDDADLISDVEHAQMVVFFNWITGRSDFLRPNSKITKDSRIFEVDNELTFNDLSIVPGAHWILENHKIAKTPISEALLDFIIQLDVNFHIRVKKNPLNNQMFPLMLQHNNKDAAYVEQSILRTVKKNLDLIKKILINHRSDKTITLIKIQNQINNYGSEQLY
jgi:hypothetical protein